MRSVNKVILMGHLAADPELRSTQAGTQVAKFKIVTNRDWQTSDGERRQSTDYHKIVAWRKLAQVSHQFLKKGSAVYLEGRIANHGFEDKEGHKRFTTEIVADVLNVISYKKNKGNEEINLVEVAVNNE